ncbi:MAG: MGMT family protein [Verrucomicrobia bacterium]|nr:MGMT family protein [Verrucomicrobiota bacterium]
MPSAAFARITAEVRKVVALIPPGRWTNYGSIAMHLNVSARHVAFIMARPDDRLPADFPWHRVVGANGTVSGPPESDRARRQIRLLRAEGLRVSKAGAIANADASYHYPGPRMEVHWGLEEAQRPSVGSR